MTRLWAKGLLELHGERRHRCRQLAGDTRIGEGRAQAKVAQASGGDAVRGNPAEVVLSVTDQNIRSR